MHLVAMLRRPEPLERAVERLAACAGVTAAEARTRLAGDLPRIAAVVADPQAAADLARRLTDAGFLAGAVAASRVEHDADRDIVASIALGDEALTATLQGAGGVREIPWSQVSLVLHGTLTTTRETTEERTTKKFSAGRALLTGGLVMRKSETTSETKTNVASQAFLYLHAGDGGPTLALYERRTNYAALGRALLPSSRANFDQVLAQIRARATNARIDGRLMRPVGLGVAPLPPPGMDPAVWKVDVAATLLAVALG